VRQVGVIYQNYTEMHGQHNIKKCVTRLQLEVLKVLTQIRRDGVTICTRHKHANLEAELNLTADCTFKGQYELTEYRSKDTQRESEEQTETEREVDGRTEFPHMAYCAAKTKLLHNGTHKTIFSPCTKASTGQMSSADGIRAHAQQFPRFKLLVYQVFLFSW
jgi:hypothetical protein